MRSNQSRGVRWRRSSRRGDHDSMSLTVKERERERERFDRGGEKLRPCGRVGERLALLRNKRESERLRVRNWELENEIRFCV